MKLDQESIDQITEALRSADIAKDEMADLIEDDLDRLAKDLVNEDANTTRLKFARVAANIAEDRYSAGSSAAKVALIVFLRHGPQAALDFVADMQHHES